MSRQKPFEYNTMFFCMATPDIRIEQWLQQHGHFITEYPMVADVIVFPGGHDVTPELYGQQKLSVTSSNWRRDHDEILVYEALRDKPKVGICRGGQFLNVMSGGDMWQDVNNHARRDTHKIFCAVTNRVHEVTSTHHQMMRPRPTADVKVLATANCADYFVDDEGMETVDELNTELVSGRDMEVIWYEDEMNLCYQPHPEYGVNSCDLHFWHVFDHTIWPIVAERRNFQMSRK